MTITAQQARETKIFVINWHKRIVDETTLFDHVTESAEETTSPRGVMHKMFIDEVDNGEKIVFELRTWRTGGNGPTKTLDTFDQREDAENEWFRRTYEYDFARDDQRDTNFYNIEIEAEAVLKECIENQ